MSDVKRKGISMKWKILIPVSILIVVVGVVNLYVAISTAGSAIQDQMEKRGLALAQSVSGNSVDPILSEDALALGNLLMDAKSQEGVMYAFITDDDNNVISHVPKNDFDNRLANANIIKGKEKYSIKEIKIKNNIIIDFAYAIKDGIGTVHIGIDRSVVDKVKSKLITEILITVLIILIIGVVITIFIANSFTKPIAVLTKAAEDISLGNVDQEIKINTKDEIEQLADAIERLRVSMNKAMSMLNE